MLTLFPRIKPNPILPAPPPAANEDPPLATGTAVKIRRPEGAATSVVARSAGETLAAAVGASDQQIDPIAAQGPDIIGFPRDEGRSVLTVLAEIPFVVELPASSPSASVPADATGAGGPLPITSEGVRESLFDAFSSAFHAANDTSAAPVESVESEATETAAAEVSPEACLQDVTTLGSRKVASSESSISTMNLFDEIDVLQEAAQPVIEVSVSTSTVRSSDIPAHLPPAIETGFEPVSPIHNREATLVAPNPSDAAPEAAQEKAPPADSSEPGAATAEPDSPPIGPERSPADAASEAIDSASAEELLPSEIALAAVASRDTASLSEAASTLSVTTFPSVEALTSASPASPGTELVRADHPAKKGGFFVLPRVSEPEVMDDSDEVEAYASAAAQSHLDAIDDTFVAHAQLLLKGCERGRALDIGTGPGQIVIKLGYQLTRWKFVGIDRSAAMIDKAREALETAPELAGRVDFLVADGNQLDFPNRGFDLVYCNSALHHFTDPQKLFSEMARLVKPSGAILLRDLRRPARFGFGRHIRKHGKHYSGEMKRLYVASVRAAYTEEELQKLLAASALRGATVFRHGKTHIGFARPIENSGARQS